MAKAQTVKTTAIGKTQLKLLAKDGHFYGLVDGNQMMVGEDADEVWRHLLDEAGRMIGDYGEGSEALAP